MKVRFYRPSKNLGNAAIKIGDLYVDFFREPYWGFFIRLPSGTKAWINIRQHRISVHRYPVMICERERRGKRG